MPPKSSSELIEHCSANALVGSIAGSKLRNTCAVGQMPGQPNGFVGPTHLRVAFEPAAKCSIIAASCAVAAGPIALLLSISGAYTSEVPAPDSNARLFIGCFEYSYDSTPVE